MRSTELILMATALLVGCDSSNKANVEQVEKVKRSASVAENEKDDAVLHNQDTVHLTGKIDTKHRLMKLYPFSLETSDGKIYLLDVNRLSGLQLGKTYRVSGKPSESHLNPAPILRNVKIEGWEPQELDVGDDPFDKFSP